VLPRHTAAAQPAQSQEGELEHDRSEVTSDDEGAPAANGATHDADDQPQPGGNPPLDH